VFTIAKIRNGSTYLGDHLCANDYYCEGERVTGRWVGNLAKEWGIDDAEIGGTDKIFERLRQGLTPDGREKLTQRAGGNVRFFDCQCSAEKSVSVMAVALGDARLREAHERLSKEAFQLALEQFASRRVRQGSSAWSEESEVTGNILAGAFMHDASRSHDPDPQLHTHFVVANVTVGKDGKRYALDPQAMCRAIRYAGKVYQASMAREVRRLGYETRDKQDARGRKVGFEIHGISDDILRRYSKRRRDIEVASAQFLLAHGREPSSAELHAIAVDTRSPKLRNISTEEVRRNQLAQLSSSEREQLVALRDRAMSRPSPAPTKACAEACKDAVGESLAHLLDWNSTVDRHSLEAEALNLGLGEVDPVGVSKAVDELTQEGHLVPLQGKGLLAMLSTPEMLALEREAISRIERGRGGLGKLAHFVASANLSAEQNEAVRFIAESPDRCVSLRGVAGTGKTTTLKHLNTVLEASGRKVLYLAPTTSAVQQLRAELGCEATTVSSYLAKLGTKRRKEMHGLTIVIDEAGLKSLRQGCAVLESAEHLNQRILLCGDTRQHEVQQSFLRLLERHSSLQRTEIREIRRQQVAEYREAVALMASGGAGHGLSKLHEMGWVRSSGGDYLNDAVERLWEKSSGGENLRDCILVAPTWAECDALTDELRKKLRASGKLVEGMARDTVRSFAWTDAQRRKAGNYRVGMEVTGTRDSSALSSGESASVVAIEGCKVHLSNGKSFDPKRSVGCVDVGHTRNVEIARGDTVLVQQNLASHKLVNGEVLEVESVSPQGEIRTRCGKVIPTNFKRIAHGYAVTSFRAQGRTARHVVTACSKLDAKTAYVSCSRGRESCTVCCPDADRLISSVCGGERPNALDVARGRSAFQEARQRRLAVRRDALHAWAQRVMRVAGSTLRKTMRVGARFFAGAVGRSIRARHRRPDVQTAPAMPALLPRPRRTAAFSREGRGGI
jgi:conjugative relaxase-like TrwC/TraI family protein